MELPDHLILCKSLPSCPSGREFRATLDGSQYYHIMTDEEVINDKFKQYFFTMEEILTNPDFFISYNMNPCGEIDIHDNTNQRINHMLNQIIQVLNQ